MPASFGVVFQLKFGMLALQLNVLLTIRDAPGACAILLLTHFIPLPRSAATFQTKALARW